MFHWGVMVESYREMPLLEWQQFILSYRWCSKEEFSSTFLNKGTGSLTLRPIISYHAMQDCLLTPLLACTHIAQGPNGPKHGYLLYIHLHIMHTCMTLYHLEKGNCLQEVSHNRQNGKKHRFWGGGGDPRSPLPRRMPGLRNCTVHALNTVLKSVQQTGFQTCLGMVQIPYCSSNRTTKAC